MASNRVLKITLTSFILFFMTSVTSHRLLAQKFSLGIKAGPLLSWAVFGDTFDKKNFDSRVKLGYYGGGMIRFPLSKDYYCVIEGGYSQKGRRILFGNGNIENNVNNQYLDGALLLRRSFRFDLGKNVPGDWFINIGPHISYWMGGKGKIGTTGDPTTGYTVVFDQVYTAAIDNKMYLNDVNRYLFGIDFGVGMHAPIRETQRIGFELRFTSGHTFYGGANSASYNFVDFEDNLRANEKVLSLTVEYMFDFDLKARKKGRSTKDKEVYRKRVKRKKR